MEEFVTAFWTVFKVFDSSTRRAVRWMMSCCCFRPCFRLVSSSRIIGSVFSRATSVLTPGTTTPPGESRDCPPPESAGRASDGVPREFSRKVEVASAAFSVETLSMRPSTRVCTSFSALIPPSCKFSTCELRDCSSAPTFCTVAVSDLYVSSLARAASASLFSLRPFCRSSPLTAFDSVMLSAFLRNASMLPTMDSPVKALVML
mmetsp:Transcript_12496/g.25447  ORF Transcript_12496/g.25447 Transcript_12496/m.25447 type:complete len:204 (-) Transcript_12496:126-737(-)